MGDVPLLTLDEIRIADAADDVLAGPGHPVSALKAGVLSPNGVAVAGVDGYLFIGNGANAWERQFLGELALPPAWLESWTRLFEARQAEVAARGVRLLNLVVPEKQVIYPDKRWPGQAVGEARPLAQLLPRLTDAARLVYPVAELRAARAAGPAYFRHNSHWTVSGCCAVLAPLLAGFDVATAPGALRFAYRSGRIVHDLTVHLFDPAPEEAAGALAPAGELMFHNRQVETTGRHAGASYGIHNPAAADARTLIVFGDSFAYDAGLTSALSAVFAKVVFVWSKSVVWPLVAEHDAELVLWESAERFLATLPQA